MIKIICLYLFVVVSVCGANGQTKLKGVVKDKNNIGVEYVTVCVDSIFTLTDRYGQFSLELPIGIKGDMTCTHIGYKKKVTPYSVYKGGIVDISLEDEVYKLGEALVVARKTKPTAILRKGMKLPGDVAFGNAPSGKYEIGPKFTVHDNFIIDSFNLKIKKCTYEHCTLRLVVYEFSKRQFSPIISKPIYFNLSSLNKNSEIKIETTSSIALHKGKDYYIGLTIVSGSKGTIHFPAYLRSGFVRNLIQGTMKKLPATVGIGIIGRKPTLAD